MEQFIKLFPLIYSLWSGILIVSGIMIAAGLYKVIKIEKLKGQELNKRNDEINLIACAVICTLNVVALFLRQDISEYILEALIMGHLWVSMYFVYICWNHLRILPYHLNSKKNCNGIDNS